MCCHHPNFRLNSPSNNGERRGSTGAIAFRHLDANWADPRLGLFKTRILLQPSVLATTFLFVILQPPQNKADAESSLG
jgi:hypothetical protein